VTGRRFPGIDLALMPIAPVKPRSYMEPKHVDPAEAVQAMLGLGAVRMMPIHYDTFVNSNDRPCDALRVLRPLRFPRPASSNICWRPRELRSRARTNPPTS
jgi:L-ascorbate metabolism protein UlaG (beta-lactamase superfamily)